MEKLPQKVFHGSAEKFDTKEARPKRQIRTQEDVAGNEVVIFDEKSFHATKERWIALAYTNERAPIESGNIRGEYGMGVNLYENNKSTLIVGIHSLVESLDVLYGSGGYIYHFSDDTFVYKEGLGDMEVVSNVPNTPIKVERVDDPVAEMEKLGVTFEFVDISLPENEEYRNPH
jgi:hypothetical protein